jgi:hypothetical protein
MFALALWLSGHDFAGERKVGKGTLGLAIVLEYRHPVAGSFGEPDVSGDNGAVDLVPEVLLQLVGDLLGQGVAWIEHRAEQALDLEPWV